jgi:hypothetical protein
MQIIIDVAQSGDGRLTGTAKPAGSAGEGRRFAGVLELVACLEALCATPPRHDVPSGPEGNHHD